MRRPLLAVTLHSRRTTMWDRDDRSLVLCEPTARRAVKSGASTQAQAQAQPHTQHNGTATHTATDTATHTDTHMSSTWTRWAKVGATTRCGYTPAPRRMASCTAVGVAASSFVRPTMPQPSRPSRMVSAASFSGGVLASLPSSPSPVVKS